MGIARVFIDFSRSTATVMLPASAQSLVADQNAIFIGIEEFAGIEGDSTEGDRDIAVADAFLDAFLGVCVECTDADVDAVAVSYTHLTLPTSDLV